jgi:hypothetical protein
MLHRGFADRTSLSTPGQQMPNAQQYGLDIFTVSLQVSRKGGSIDVSSKLAALPQAL